MSDLLCTLFWVIVLCVMNQAEINTIGNLGDLLHRAVAKA
jgi:hypothetical protein